MVRYINRALTKREQSLFHRFTIAVALSHYPTHWNDGKIHQWITLRGGKYVRENKEIDWKLLTHLVVDEKEFKKMGPEVKKALSHNRIHVVALEWLEFSMIQKKVLPVSEYSMRTVLKEEREKERRLKEVAKGSELAERAVNTNFFHVYYDQTHFRYELEITRECEATDDENEQIVAGDREKYTLTIYESHALPNLYFFLAKFSKSKHDAQPKYYRPSESPGLFWQEFSLFESFFQIKTGVPWNHRLLSKSTGSAGGYFQYLVPTGGKPVGWVPTECIPKEGQEVKILKEEDEDTVMAGCDFQAVETQNPQNVTAMGNTVEKTENQNAKDDTVMTGTDNKTNQHDIVHNKQERTKTPGTVQLINGFKKQEEKKKKHLATAQIDTLMIDDGGGSLKSDQQNVHPQKLDTANTTGQNGVVTILIE
ncbi:hypothetical protein QBC38DRAFT_523403 [Podospora fimiseda]|uniref:BRCT domain-containing protein n=1 Tax=Podospora fimiseda TaxID=252190 RepID=A0AAN7BYW1_9PEZI|nr:hypothetical protein QBC38DRAFT_523403 [Podospora fimiseda]